MPSKADLDALPALPRDDEGPVFHEPWQAQAFAMALQLSEAGCFSWQEWTSVFSDEISRAQASGDPDLGDTYYNHWLAALERICAEKGLAEPGQLIRRKEDWRRAYLNTPHGQPINLAAGQ